MQQVPYPAAGRKEGSEGKNQALRRPSYQSPHPVQRIAKGAADPRKLRPKGHAGKSRRGEHRQRKPNHAEQEEEKGMR